MTRFPTLFSAASCAVMLALTVSAHAVPLTLTLDNPNQTVAIPTTGSVTVDFNGTFTTTGNFAPSGAGLFTPFLLNSGTGIFPTFGPHISDPAYSGVDQTFFSVQVDQFTAPGLYSYQFLSATPVMFSFDAFDGETNVFEELPFSILVVPASAVPEPSAWAAFGFGVLGLGLLTFKARQRTLTA